MAADGGVIFQCKITGTGNPSPTQKIIHFDDTQQFPMVGIGNFFVGGVTNGGFDCIIRENMEGRGGMLEKFYRDNYRIVYGYLLSLCGEPAVAEDLASETFLRAMERIDSFDPRYRASTWLCTIGRNLYLNRCKRAKREVPLEDAAVCAAPSPEALYLQKEQAQEVIRAANALPPEQRQVLFLRLEGLSFREIGAALGRTETWARVNFYRAKGKIISEMEEGQ